MRISASGKSSTHHPRLIGPQTALSQTLSYREAISGQLFVAILIARLVGMNIAQMTHTPPPAQEE